MRFVKKMFLVIFLLLLAGCGSQNSVQTQNQQPMASSPSNLADSLRQAGASYLSTQRSLTIDPQAVFEKAVVQADPSYYLVDIRSDEHYAKHHIPGSIHVAYADTWRPNKTDFLPRDKKIVVIDYSGHSSSQVVALWSLMGFDAIAMKHGMAGWSKDKEVIGGSPIPCEPKNFPVVKETAPASSHELPAFDTKAADFRDLLQARAELATGKPVVILADEALAKISAKNVFVLDVRAPEHFQAGHIVNAVNVPFQSLMEEANLKKLPPGQPIIVVCYDGHAASQATRLLNLLGYDAIALRDGMGLWSGDASVIGGPVLACNILDRVTAALNAPLTVGPSTAAT